jgi:acetaldehyde dehydrogenase (acetylating)
MKFALEKPAFRIVVNTPSSVGAVGYTTDLIPSMTLGPGTWGGSIISENVSAMHLMNIKTLAFETRPVNPGNAVNSLGTDKNFNLRSETTPGSFMQQIEERLRARAGNVNVATFTVKKSDNGNGGKSKFGSGISESEIQKIIREFNSK